MSSRPGPGMRHVDAPAAVVRRPIRRYAGPVLPLVGVTTYVADVAWSSWERRSAVLPESYFELVAAAGAVRCCCRRRAVPPEAPRRGRPRSIAALDGLILTGGGDVDPAAYGEEPDPEVGGVDRDRDASERALLAAALDADLPVLAICRGCQVLNVSLGGTLHQHLPDLVGNDGPPPGAPRLRRRRGGDGARDDRRPRSSGPPPRPLLAPPGHPRPGPRPRRHRPAPATAWSRRSNCPRLGSSSPSSGIPRRADQRPSTPSSPPRDHMADRWNASPSDPAARPDCRRSVGRRRRSPRSPGRRHPGRPALDLPEQCRPTPAG